MNDEIEQEKQRAAGAGGSKRFRTLPRLWVRRAVDCDCVDRAGRGLAARIGARRRAGGEGASSAGARPQRAVFDLRSTQRQIPRLRGDRAGQDAESGPPRPRRRAIHQRGDQRSDLHPQPHELFLRPVRAQPWLLWAFGAEPRSLAQRARTLPRGRLQDRRDRQDSLPDGLDRERQRRFSRGLRRAQRRSALRLRRLSPQARPGEFARRHSSGGRWAAFRASL